MRRQIVSLPCRWWNVRPKLDNWGMRSAFYSSCQWSLLIDQSESKKMLPAYSLPYQPYFVFPSLVSPGHSIMYPNNGTYVIPSFLPQTHFQHQNSNQDVGNPLQMAFQAQLQPFFKHQGVSMLENKDLSKNQNKTVKEKIIKKLANRPSTYLTQRKYYLAQPLSSQEHSQRILRPRYQKKKSSKSKHHSLPRKQHIDYQLDFPLPSIKEEEINLKEELTLQKEKLSQHAALKQEYDQDDQQIEEQAPRQEGNAVDNPYTEITK